MLNPYLILGVVKDEIPDETKEQLHELIKLFLIIVFQPQIPPRFRQHAVCCINYQRYDPAPPQLVLYLTSAPSHFLPRSSFASDITS